MIHRKPLIDLTKERPAATRRDPNDLCADLDEDCRDVPCAVSCWLDAPEKGICPYIRQRKTS